MPSYSKFRSTTSKLTIFVRVIALFSGESVSSTVHALVEFVEEGNTGIVPLQRVNNSENVQAGERITVHWYDGKKYPALLLLSGI